MVLQSGRLICIILFSLLICIVITYSYSELNWDGLHIIITFTYIITPLLIPVSKHKPVLARVPSGRLNKIQKKAIRIITLNRYNSHTEPLFKQLNMLKIEDLLKLQQLTFYFKFNEGSLPVYLQNWDITPNSHVHNYNTRELGCIHTFKVKHEFAQKMAEI